MVTDSHAKWSCAPAQLRMQVFPSETKIDACFPQIQVHSAANHCNAYDEQRASELNGEGFLF